MACPKCKSDNVTFDSTTNMCYCNDCHQMFDLPDEDKESFEDDNVFEEKELGVLSAFFIGVALLIPIVNIIVLLLIIGSDYKEEYKKPFIGLFLGYIVVGICIYLYGTLTVRDYLSEHRKQIVQQLNNVIEKFDIDERERVLKIDLPEKAPNIDYYVKTYLSAHKVEGDDETEVKYLNPLHFKYIDDSYMYGDSILSMLDSLQEYTYSIVVQTEAMRERYNQDTYRNFGVVLKQADQNDNGNYILPVYSKRDTYQYFLSDYDELRIASSEDLYNKKYIFYLKTNSLFRLNAIYSENDDLLGLAITEISEEDE